MSQKNLTAQDLAEMPQADFDKLDHTLIKRVLAEERKKAARLQRRLEGLKTGDLSPSSLNSIADTLGVSRQTIEKTQARAFLKIRHQNPNLRHLLSDQS